MAPEKTPLEKWVEYGWLKAEPTSPREIADLLSIVSRDLADAETGQSTRKWIENPLQNRKRRLRGVHAVNHCVSLHLCVS